MTLEELKEEYGEKNVFHNQFELGKFVQEYGIRKKIKFIYFLNDFIIVCYYYVAFAIRFFYSKF